MVVNLYITLFHMDMFKSIHVHMYNSVTTTSAVIEQSIECNQEKKQMQYCKIQFTCKYTCNMHMQEAIDP